MGEPAPRQWTLEDFLAWEARQPVRYELVHGQPVMMAGGTQAHDAIAINIVSSLKARLRGSRCRPGSADLRVLTGTGHVRYPDATIDCGPFRPDSNNASEPVTVFEILSKSTAWTDLHEKLRDYDMTPTIRHYVLIAQDEPKVVVWSRGETGRLALDGTSADLESVIPLPAAGIALPLSEIYDGLVPGTFPPGQAP